MPRRGSGRVQPSDGSVAAGAASTRGPFDEPTVDRLLAEPIVQQLMRATGTAAIESFFPEREQFHSFIVDSHVSLLQSASGIGTILHDVQVSRPDGAWRRAAIFVGDTIRTQPMIMGYPDRFSLLGVVMIAAILSVGPAKRDCLRRRHALNASTNETALCRLCFFAVSY